MLGLHSNVIATSAPTHSYADASAVVCAHANAAATASIYRCAYTSTRNVAPMYCWPAYSISP